MADKKTAAQGNSGEAVQESVYPKNVLVASAKAIFGVNPEVAAGALYGNAKDELTKTEAQEAINKFLKSKPKGGNK
ncbi:hypothetical protein [Mahella australiensis]|uniref:YqzN/YkzM domain-containing protein n=1 Tax=Mahella australiensis (strain DSM 15567 / CIP 107919 / 50-1 BON) TaxID=697281 RepID=F3ZZH3_MAHA5|nr:hypothetical protein [Mahella australiensis]AEE95783.1 hypothetical protein Mahau_0580 [Mahella australiensis 50-1 BON]